MSGLSFIGTPRSAPLVVELPSACGTQGLKGTSLVTATDRMGKPRSVLITQAAKRSLAPVRRRSNLRKELLVPEMLDSKRFHDAVARHTKAEAEMRAASERKARAARSSSLKRVLTMIISGQTFTPASTATALPASSPKAGSTNINAPKSETAEPHGREVTWAHQRSLPSGFWQRSRWGPMALLLANRPRTATPWGYMIAKKIWQGKVRQSAMIIPKKPDSGDLTWPLVGVRKTPLEPLPRHPEFECPPTLRAITAPFDRKKKTKTRTASDYLRMHHLAWKELTKKNHLRRMQRTDSVIIDDLQSSWKTEGTSGGENGMCPGEGVNTAPNANGGPQQQGTSAEDACSAVVTVELEEGEIPFSVQEAPIAGGANSEGAAQVDASVTQSAVEEVPVVPVEQLSTTFSETSIAPLDLDLDLRLFETSPLDFGEGIPASGSPSTLLNDENAMLDRPSDVPFGIAVPW